MGLYFCIDLKSFYASAECVERGLDPMTASLVVADRSRGSGALCLAVSPALKNKGVKNRCRLYEVPQNLNYIIAKPRMKAYMEYSLKVYSVYLHFFSSEDIHVYSVDECFIDASPYMNLYKKTPYDLASAVIEEVKKQTGMPAAAGIGENLFLAKVALDITAKKNKDGIGIVDLKTFEREIKFHRPLTDIWGIGKSKCEKLHKIGVDDLDGVTKISEDKLYKLFGVNAEYLIDHAKGYEPCTIADIKNYKAKSNSISNSQILFEDYNFGDGLMIVGEMTETLALELVDKNLMTNSLSLGINYSKDCFKPLSKSIKLPKYTDSFNYIYNVMKKLYEDNVSDIYPIRKISVTFNNLLESDFYIADIFTDTEKADKERRLTEKVLEIKGKYGKNSVIKCANLKKKSTAVKRNGFIGGHNG